MNYNQLERHFKKLSVFNHTDKKRINFLHQRRAGGVQELRYSAIEITELCLQAEMPCS